jgi:hypothetical protein
MYLIERRWTDSMENHPRASHGWLPLGYVEKEIQAIMICDSAHMTVEGYPLSGDHPKGSEVPLFRYRELPDLSKMMIMDMKKVRMDPYDYL